MRTAHGVLPAFPNQPLAWQGLGAEAEIAVELLHRVTVVAACVPGDRWNQKC